MNLIRIISRTFVRAWLRINTFSGWYVSFLPFSPSLKFYPKKKVSSTTSSRVYYSVTSWLRRYGIIEAELSRIIEIKLESLLRKTTPVILLRERRLHLARKCSPSVHFPLHECCWICSFSTLYLFRHRFLFTNLEARDINEPFLLWKGLILQGTTRRTWIS